MRRPPKCRWCWGLLLLFACGKAPTPSPSQPPPATQAGYCDRLQPLLDKTVREARIGTPMSCLDVPGTTGLGRFGPPSTGEEASLADCFEQRSEYEALLQAPEGQFQLAIDDTFTRSSESGASASLSSLVPWLPHFDISTEAGTAVSASVTIKEARFVTLVGLATKLQGQPGELRCLQALCSPEYTYVHKALVGVPTVSVSAKDRRGNAVSIGPLAATVDFHQRELSQGSREISSTAPVTLAIARTPFRTAQTERLCQFCGRRGQTCCASGPACDGGLGCIAERCVEIGGPGQPCDGTSCAGGSTCVDGECHLECGGKGQPCCGRACAGKLHCTVDPVNSIEYQLGSQDVEVGGGLLGTDEDRTFGGSSCGPLMTRGRFAVTKIGAGRGQCDKAWWFDPKNTKDCRVAVHFSVSPLSSIVCRVEGFAEPPPTPDVCLP